MNNQLTCFKAYDIRGKLDIEFNEDIAYRIGRATAEKFNANEIVLGFDARETSPSLAKAVAKGISEAGCNVLDIGLAGTEEMYWAVSEFKADAGIEITASHNPIEYNGIKIVKNGSHPLTKKEFVEIKTLAEQNEFLYCQQQGSVKNKIGRARSAYIEKLISFVDIKRLKPLKVIINSGNGAAGPVIDALKSVLEAKGCKTNFVKLYNNPDPLFPNGIPNPLLEENWPATSDVVRAENADFGVAFDGDFDRCFLFDNLGNFIPGEYIVGLLAEFFLFKEQKQKIVIDPRLIWNTSDIIENSGGYSVISKTGHAFMKSMMRKENAIYGGEISAHHYFRDFSYCDSGIIPWLLIWELLSTKKILIADLISERRHLFPSSGEMNFEISNPSSCINEVKKFYSSTATSIDELDGISMSFENWRFNLRMSNTEPLVRLNVETRGNIQLLRKKVKELKSLIIHI